MEKLRKTVLSGALIYALYGLISLFNLGVFIPPIPLKPFLFSAFLLAYVLVSRQDYSPLLRISLLIWMMSLIFVGQYFVEIFFDVKTIDFYLNNVEPFVLIGSITAFIAFTYKIVSEMNYSSYQYYLPIIISSAIIPLTIILKDQIVFDWGMIAVAILIFVFERINKEQNTEEKLEKVLYVLNGVAAITLIERVTYLFA